MPSFGAQRDAAQVQHDILWPNYMRAWARVRASGGGRGSFAAQQAFLRASEKVAKVQRRLRDIDEAEFMHLNQKIARGRENLRG
jgi:hypothetical protein